jgi:hypothetical protein
LDSSGTGYRPVAGSCEHDHEPLHSIKDVKFLDWLHDFLAFEEGVCPTGLIFAELEFLPALLLKVPFL